MNYLFAALVILYLLVDRVIAHSRRRSGVSLHNWVLANDPEFIEDLTEAIKKSLQRDLLRTRQDMMRG